MPQLGYFHANKTATKKFKQILTAPKKGDSPRGWNFFKEIMNLINIFCRRITIINELYCTRCHKHDDIKFIYAFYARWLADWRMSKERSHHFRMLILNFYYPSLFAVFTHQANDHGQVKCMCDSLNFFYVSIFETQMKFYSFGTSFFAWLMRLS